MARPAALQPASVSRATGVHSTYFCISLMQVAMVTVLFIIILGLMVAVSVC